MIISAKVILKPRQVRRCDWCGDYMRGPVLRLFGMAERCDKPYAVRLHPECCKDPDPKIRAAKKALL